MRSRLTISAASVALALGVSACGSGSISTSDLEATVSEQLEEQVGQTPDSVDCPDELPAEVGAEVRCTLTAGEDELGVTLTVTSVDGDRAEFDIAVDGAPAEG